MRVLALILSIAALCLPRLAEAHCAACMPTDHATDVDAHHAATVAGDLDIEDLASNMETTDICTGDGAQGLTCGDSIRLGGTIAGNVMVTSDGTGSTLGTDECQGDLYILTASITMVLPEVTGADGYNCCFYGTGANALTIDPNAADEIILDGTAIGTGDAIVSTGAAGDKICVTNHAATGWITSGKAGTWADESP